MHASFEFRRPFRPQLLVDTMFRTIASKISYGRGAVVLGGVCATKVAHSYPVMWCEEPLCDKHRTSVDHRMETRARGSYGLKGPELVKMLSQKADYKDGLEACARNVKMGPFTASSGLVLDYLLNAATSTLDKDVAMQITRMTLDVINNRFKPSNGEMILVIGGEMGGGVMSSQCVAVAPLTHKHMLQWCDFAYMRKKRKESGTLQQIEAPNHITSRTPSSPAMKAVWLDECNSTGSELLKNVKVLKEEYNIEVVGAVYLVDRSRDRKNLPLERLRMADSALRQVEVLALYDLEDIAPLIKL